MPQASILGQLLFVVYIAEFKYVFFSSDFHLYADDTQFYLSYSPDEILHAGTAINFDLQDLAKTSSYHHLQVNPYWKESE